MIGRLDTRGLSELVNYLELVDRKGAPPAGRAPDDPSGTRTQRWPGRTCGPAHCVRLPALLWPQAS